MKILAEHPLTEVFAALEGAEAGGKEESDLCAFLEKMFQTTPGAALLQSAMPYAAAGLAATSPRVRKLACSQMGRAIAQLDDEEEAQAAETTLLPFLIEAVADPDGGVAAAAAEVIANLAGGGGPSPSSPYPSPTRSEATTTAMTATSATATGRRLLVPTLALLTPFAKSHDAPEVRLRAYALAAAIAGRSSAAAAAVAECGLMESLMREVDNRSDALAAMAAMELLAELVSSEEGSGAEETAAGLGVVGPLLPKLAGLVSGVGVGGGGGGGGGSGSGVVPGYVRARAATVGARIAAAAGAKMSRDGGGSGGAAGLLPSPGGEMLLAALTRVAQDREDNGEVAEAAMVAAATLGECAVGAAAMVAAAAAAAGRTAGASSSSSSIPSSSSSSSLLVSVVDAALGAAGPSRVAALHALASIAGAGSDTGRRSPSSAGAKATPAFPHDPVGVPATNTNTNTNTNADADAAAAADAESVIRAAVYDVCASRGSTPAERVWSLLERGGDSFLELRVATYRLISAMGRRVWFAAELTAHSALFDKILDAVGDGGEMTPPGCKWRHQAAIGLLAAAEAPQNTTTTAGVQQSSIVELAVDDARTSRLRAAVARGPYGAGGSGTSAVPQVATAKR